MIENEIFGDDDDEGSVMQHTAGVSGTAEARTDFDLEPSDEESGLIDWHCHHFALKTHLCLLFAVAGDGNAK